MRGFRRFRSVALLLMVALACPVLVGHAQDSTYQFDVFIERGTGRVMSQAGGGAVYNQRFRVTTAAVNTGATLLPARAGIKYRLVDAHMIPIGGAVATCTAVVILGTQATASATLVSAAAAAMTQSAWVGPGLTNVANVSGLGSILADGASFVANDVNTAITIGKTGGSCATVTNVDVVLSYALEV
jgi:hypothetical protein